MKQWFIIKLEDKKSFEEYIEYTNIFKKYSHIEWVDVLGI